MLNSPPTPPQNDGNPTVGEFLTAVAFIAIMAAVMYALTAPFAG